MELTVPQLFEAQAARNPDACAVTFRGKGLTYRELNERANQLAHHLRGLGVGPEVLVAICLGRSFERIIALLAVLKAGGAYVPLDPTYLSERLAFMLVDSGAPVILTEARLAAQLPLKGISALCLDEFIPSGPVENLQSNVSPENLAYVIYTSGSTGPPKGAMLHHAGFRNYLLWAVDAYAGAAGYGAPSHSSISFDLTITSIFVPLLSGRTVELVPAGPGVDQLAAALRQKKGFSLVKLTPAHLELLRHQFQPHEVAGQTMAFVVGGENLFGDTIAFWQANAPDTVFFNEYGPTETVVGCCVYAVPRGRRFDKAVPIGKPIANSQMHVLDERMNPVAVGDVGELYIGGTCVGRGYLNRPQLTAEKFLPDPWRHHPGARLYRSGDLARMLPDGNLEFLGRIDDQIKIRGYRLELGEIDVAVRQSPDVRDVVTLSVGTRHKRLVSYVVPESGKRLDVEKLRTFVRRKLPNFMVPSLFMSLETLPLDHNGKVDRRALPAPTRDRDGGPITPPRNALQKQLVAIWEEALGIHPIGIEDNFFALGGDSLQAVEIFLGMEKLLGRNFPLALLVQAQTIEQLEPLIQSGNRQSSSLVPMNKSGAGRPFFCIHAAGGNVLNHFDLSHRLDCPFYSLQAQGLDGVSKPYNRLEEMALHYLREIRACQPKGPYLLGGISFGGMVALEIAQQLLAHGEEVALLVFLDANAEGRRRSLIRKIPGRVRLLTRLQPGDRLRYIAGQMKAAATMTSSAVLQCLKRFYAKSTPSMTKTLEDISRINANAILNYRPQSYPGRAILYRARESPWSGDLGWGKVITGQLDVQEVPGSHDTFIREPHVRVLARRLNAALREAELTVSSAADAPVPAEAKDIADSSLKVMLGLTSVAQLLDDVPTLLF